MVVAKQVQKAMQRENSQLDLLAVPGGTRLTPGRRACDHKVS
jgi:hypothetical protein